MQTIFTYYFILISLLNTKQKRYKSNCLDFKLQKQVITKLTKSCNLKVIYFNAPSQK